MKAMAIVEYGKVPLQLMDLPEPEVGDYDVLTEIHAASFNPIDFKIRDGQAQTLLKYEMPLILGNDFSGIVKQVGNKVKKFKVGDEVYGRPNKSRIGTFAEYIAVHENEVALKPANLSFEEATSIPLVGLTSYQAIHDILQLSSGQKILIQAGSGGVGTFAIQLAKSMGLFVATTTSKAGAELVKSLGADQIIDYKTEQFDEMLKNYDGVFDTIGGETLERSFKVVKEGGKIVSIAGVPNADMSKLTELEKRYHVEYTYLFMKPSGDQLTIITKLIESGQIKPVIDQVFPFEDAQKAIEYSEIGRAKGKIILSIKQK